MDEAIASGQTTLLADLKKPDLVGASCAGLTTYLGDNPSTAPCLDPNDLICGQHLNGNTSFDFRADSPLDAVLVGDIVSSTFAGGPGQAVIEISLLGTPVTLQPFERTCPEIRVVALLGEPLSRGPSSYCSESAPPSRPMK